MSQRVLSSARAAWPRRPRTVTVSAPAASVAVAAVSPAAAAATPYAGGAQARHAQIQRLARRLVKAAGSGRPAGVRGL